MLFGFAPDNTVATIVAVTMADEKEKDQVAAMFSRLTRLYGVAAFISEGWQANATKWEREASRVITPPSERADRQEVLMITFQCADGTRAMASHPIHSGKPRTVDDAELQIASPESRDLAGRFMGRPPREDWRA